MTKQDFIFSLIRSALWQQPYPHFDMTPGEYHAVMEEAEKQCVQGLIIDCLRSNNMGLQKKCVIHMMKVNNALLAENRQLNKNVILLKKLFERYGITYLMVKGQSLSTLYPKPELRVPGDIDCYIKKIDFEKALLIIENNWGCRINSESRHRQHRSFEYQNNDFELHFQLATFANRRSQFYFNNLIENQERTTVCINEDKVCTLDPTLNAVYIFIHLYHHFRTLGVALRQLCDWAMVLHHYQNEIDKRKVEEMLKTLGYIHAFAAFGSILVDKLGLPEEEFPIPITEKDRKYGAKALKHIIKHGNWGNYERKVHDSNTKLRNLENAKIQLVNYFSFFFLSPKENFYQLVYEMPRKAYSRLFNKHMY